MAETAEKEPEAAKKRSTAERLDALENEVKLLCDAIEGLGQYGRWTKQEIMRLRDGLPEEAATA